MILNSKQTLVEFVLILFKLFTFYILLQTSLAKYAFSLSFVAVENIFTYLYFKDAG